MKKKYTDITKLNRVDNITKITVIFKTFSVSGEKLGCSNQDYEKNCV